MSLLRLHCCLLLTFVAMKGLAAAPACDVSAVRAEFRISVPVAAAVHDGDVFWSMQGEMGDNEAGRFDEHNRTLEFTPEPWEDDTLALQARDASGTVVCVATMNSHSSTDFKKVGQQVTSGDDAVSLWYSKMNDGPTMPNVLSEHDVPQSDADILPQQAQREWAPVPYRFFRTLPGKPVAQTVYFVSERHYVPLTGTFNDIRESNGSIYVGKLTVMLSASDLRFHGSVPSLPCDVNQCVFDRADSFFAEIAKWTGNRPEANSVLLYVHGFNNRFEEEVYKLALVAAASHFQGVPVLFDWPSGHTSWYDEYRLKAVYRHDVIETESGSQRILNLLLDELHALPSHPTIHVLAHSLGSRLLLRSLQQENAAGHLLPLDQVILAAPDVAIEPAYPLDSVLRQNQSFQQLLEPLLRSGKIKNVTMYGSDRDLALWISSKVNGKPAAGHLPPVLRFTNFDQIGVGNLKSGFPYHDYYVSCQTVLDDIGQLLATDRGTHRAHLQLASGTFAWYSLLPY